MPDCCEQYVNDLENADDANKASVQIILDKCRSFQKLKPNELYATLNTVEPSMYTTFTKCMQDRIIDADKPLLSLINDYEDKKIDAITASELNRNTMTLYEVDLNYTVGKIFLFIILILAYFYLLNGASLIEPIKQGIQKATNKITNFTSVKVPIK
jgi:hypothetical protein